MSVPRAALRITHTLAPGIYFRYDADATSRQGHGGGRSLAHREAYLNYRDGSFDLRIGLQTIAWGRADILNPTDNLTPYRYTWITLSDGDQRVGSAGVRVAYRTSIGQAIFVALPFFRPSVVPLGDAGPLQVREMEPRHPADTFGVKFEGEARGLEWSVSWMQGPSLRPTLMLSTDIESSGDLLLAHPDTRVLGADFSQPWRSTILRGEVAYTRAEDCCDVAGLEFRKSDNLFAVVGVERTLPAGWRWVSQVFHKQQLQDPARLNSPNPLFNALARGSDVLNDETRDGFTGLSVGFYPSSPGVRFTGSLDAAWIPQSEDWVVRPRLKVSLNDDLALQLGADLYRGDRESPLGRLRDNSLLMAWLEMSFGKEWGG